jgi:hypothetical protein
MARRRPEDPTLRLPVRVTPRHVLNLVIGLIGVGIALVLVVAAVVNAGSGSSSGLLTAVGLMLTAALAAYLYLPALVRTVRIGLRRPMRVVLDRTGITVTTGPATDLVESWLGWDDCVAVVTSPLPTPDGRGVNYVQFLPARPEAVRFPPDNKWILATAALVRVPPCTAAMTSFARPGRPELGELLAWVRAHRSELRIVESVKG